MERLVGASRRDRLREAQRHCSAVLGGVDRADRAQSRHCRHMGGGDAGDYPTFAKFAGVVEDKRGGGFPAWLVRCMGHAYHGVQSRPGHALARDRPARLTIRTPSRSRSTCRRRASRRPASRPRCRCLMRTSRCAGRHARTRGAASLNDYMSGSEHRTSGAWYRENVAEPLGIEAVPAQARVGYLRAADRRQHDDRRPQA